MKAADVVWGWGVSFGGRGRHLGVVGVIWGWGASFVCCVYVVVAGCCCGCCSCVWMAGSSWSLLGVCLYSFACSHLCSCHRGRWVLGALVVGIDVAAGIIVVMDVIMGDVVVVVVVAVVVVMGIVVVVVIVVVAVGVGRCVVVVVVVVVEEVVTVVTCHV